MYDIADATKAYLSLSRKKETVRIGSGGYAESLISEGDSQLVYLNYCCYREVFRRTKRVHVRYTGAINISAGVNTQAEVMDRFGLNLKQFIPTAWELLPWSFLADYFSNIGNVLAYDNSIYQKLNWLCKGTMYEEETLRRHDPDFANARLLKPGGKPLIFDGKPSYAIIQRRVVSRGRVTAGRSINFSDIAFQLPDYWKQFANMGALLVGARAIHPQRFGRLK